METGNLTTTQNAPWIPEIIANESLGLLGSYLNLGATVAKDSELAPVRVGQVLSIPRRGTIVAQQKAQGTPTSVQRPAADDVQVTVNQHWYVKLLEEDFTRSMQTGSVLPGYVEDAVIVLAEKIENNLISNFSEFDNIDFDQGTAGDSAVKALGRVRTRMVKNKVPKLAQLYGYVSPEFVQLIGESTAFIDPKLIPNNRPLTEGTVGRAKGFDIFEGQLVPRSGSPGWDQNFFYTRNALVLASRPLLQPGNELGVQATTVQSEAGLALRLVRYYDGDEMGVVVQVDTVFGSGVNDERQGFVLESR
jgi:hypothetical protein